jgi:hypothetical protein
MVRLDGHPGPSGARSQRSEPLISDLAAARPWRTSGTPPVRSPRVTGPVDRLGKQTTMLPHLGSRHRGLDDNMVGTLGLNQSRLFLAVLSGVVRARSDGTIESVSARVWLRFPLAGS